MLPPVAGSIWCHRYAARLNYLATKLAASPSSFPAGATRLSAISASGQVQYDNFAGHWGDLKELNRFLQAYAVEKARLEARKRGHSVTEQALADGSIKLSIQLSGGAA